MELLIAVLEVHCCSFTGCVFGATAKEATDNKFVDLAFVGGGESVGGDVNDGVDGRMGLIIIFAHARLGKAAVHKTVSGVVRDASFARETILRLLTHPWANWPQFSLDVCFSTRARRSIPLSN